VSARHRAKSPWFRSARGRAEQPPGRHSEMYRDAHDAGASFSEKFGQVNADGRYPMGQPLRVPHDPDALADDLDRGNNDPHTRVTLQEAAQ
jgi:hypothetical protein